MSISPENRNKGEYFERLMHEVRESDRPPTKPAILKQEDINVERVERSFLGYADSFVAEEYVKFHRMYNFINDVVQNRTHQALRFEVLEAVCRDEYSTSDHSVTLIASSEKNDYLGSVRVDEAQIGIKYPLETFKLWKKKDRRNWPHGRKKAGDLGRVVVHKSQRPDNTAVILKSVTDKAFEYARERGIDYLYFTTQTDPPKLYNRFREIGLRPKRVHGVELNLDEPDARELFETFSGYWKDQKPKLFILKVPGVEKKEVDRAIDVFTSRRDGQLAQKPSGKRDVA